MRASFASRGLFRASAAYYCFKVASTLSLAATAIAMLFLSKSGNNGSVSFLDAAASAVTLGLFWQQAGWLAHDFCHQQVFQNRNTNNSIALFLGNVCQGFSVGWWKAKHNQHHAAPNELDADTHRALDPDIDTLPLIAWSRDMLATAAGAPRAIMRHQHRYFVAVLLFARLAWAQGSAAHALTLLPTKKGAARGARVGACGGEPQNVRPRRSLHPGPALCVDPGRRGRRARGPWGASPTSWPRNSFAASSSPSSLSSPTTRWRSTPRSKIS